MSDLYLEQRELEMQAVTNGVLRYRNALSDCDRAAQPPEMRYIARGMEGLVPAIEELQRKVVSGETMKGMQSWGLPIISVSAEKLALITLATIFNYDQTNKTSIAMYVADAVLMEVVYEMAKFHEPGLVTRLDLQMKGGYKADVRSRLKKAIPTYATKVWTKQVRMWVGSTLVGEAFSKTDVIDKCSVLTPTGRWAHGIKIDSKVREDIENSHSTMELLKPMLLPMIVPPMDWTTLWDGGYLIGDDEFSCVAPLVKTGFKNHLELITPERMGLHVACVNHLQQTRWTVNEFIADTVAHIWDTESELGSVLKTQPLPLVSKEGVDWDNPDEALCYKLSARAVHDHNRKTVGQRSLYYYLRDVAEQFKKYKAFYFQWQVDFRARDYPRFCGMDPQGDKLNKSYIKFAEGKPLGPDGYRWLTIHLSNCMGNDKETLDDRVKMVEDRAEEIHEWVRDPLANKGWAVEDTTMTLAAAQEWSYASLSDTPNDCLSCLPIAIDGKCNGLQHLSALARDPVGAAATCLIPNEIPQDIYSLVWAKVDERVQQTIKRANLDQIPFVLPEKLTTENVKVLSDSDKAQRKRQQDAVSAKHWLGKTSRALVKRGAMTWGYGVTEQGIMTQLITDGFLNDGDGKLVQHASVYASYMRDCIYWAVNNTVLSARDVMEWLQYVVKVASEMGKAIWWTNPAGMRIHQEYLKPERREVKTTQGKYYFYIKGVKERKLAKKKQKNGIAPNFVHSIDAAHMAMVVLRLKEEGITDMHMIHDSFGVHACHTELLNRIVREEFVKIHERNLLQEFKEEVEEQLGVELEPYPTQGDFDVRQVIESKYAFS